MTPAEMLAVVHAADAQCRPEADGATWAAACEAEAAAWAELVVPDVHELADPAVRDLLVRAAYSTAAYLRGMAKRERAEVQG